MRKLAKLAVLFFLVAALATACAAHGAVLLTIDAVGASGPLTAPDSVDQIAVLVTGLDGKTTLLEKSYPLDATSRFPLTLGLNVGKDTPGTIKVSVTILLKEKPVGGAETVATIKGGEDTQATVKVVVD